MQAIIQYRKLCKNAEEQYHQHALDHEKQTRPSTSRVGSATTQEESDLAKNEFRPEAPALSNDNEICSDDGGWKRYNGSTGGDENRTGVLFNSWISWR
jgi:hypothetical protein